LLRLQQAEIAERAHVSVVTIRRLERGQGGERVEPDPGTSFLSETLG
jgi:transcriptional regulator with XRE-family HTH domain